jgi:hypothetical protein
MNTGGIAGADAFAVISGTSHDKTPGSEAEGSEVRRGGGCQAAGFIQSCIRRMNRNAAPREALRQTSILSPLVLLHPDCRQLLDKLGTGDPPLRILSPEQPPR